MFGSYSWRFKLHVFPFLVINEQTALERNLSVNQVRPGCLLLNFNLQCRWRIDVIPFLFKKQMREHLKLKQTVQTNSLILVWFNIICLEIWLHQLKPVDFNMVNMQIYVCEFWISNALIREKIIGQIQPEAFLTLRQMTSRNKLLTSPSKNSKFIWAFGYNKTLCHLFSWFQLYK